MVNRYFCKFFVIILQFPKKYKVKNVLIFVFGAALLLIFL